MSPKKTAPPEKADRPPLVPPELLAILRQADEQKRLQNLPPQEIITDLGRTQLVELGLLHIAQAQEVKIEDQTPSKPAFVQADDDGWAETS